MTRSSLLAQHSQGSSTQSDCSVATWHSSSSHCCAFATTVVSSSVTIKQQLDSIHPWSLSQASMQMAIWSSLQLAHRLSFRSELVISSFAQYHLCVCLASLCSSIGEITGIAALWVYRRWDTDATLAYAHLAWPSLGACLPSDCSGSISCFVFDLRCGFGSNFKCLHASMPVSGSSYCCAASIGYLAFFDSNAVYWREHASSQWYKTLSSCASDDYSRTYLTIWI